MQKHDLDCMVDMMQTYPIPLPEEAKKIGQTYSVGRCSIYDLYPYIELFTPALFSEMVKNWRRANKLTRKEIDQKIGVHEGFTLSMEKGPEIAPYVTGFIKLCQLMGFNPGDIRSLLYTFRIEPITSYIDVDADMAKYLLIEFGCSDEFVRKFDLQFRKRQNLSKFKANAMKNNKTIWATLAYGEK